MACYYDSYLGYCWDGIDYENECFDCYNPTLSGGNNGGQQQVSIYGQGNSAQNNPNPLNQYLQAILSGFALLQHAPYVPTNQQPVTQNYSGAVGQNQCPGGYVYNAATRGCSPLSGGGSQNTLGGFQNFIEQNKGAALLLGAGAVLLFMRPPTRR